MTALTILADIALMPPAAFSSIALPEGRHLMRCADHVQPDDRLPYLAWHEKSERSQTRCSECNLWQWPWEMVASAPVADVLR